MTRIPKTDYIDLRVWKEYYFRYSEEPQEQRKGDANYTLDEQTLRASQARNRLIKLLGALKVYDN